MIVMAIKPHNYSKILQTLLSNLNNSDRLGFRGVR